jgi:pimeloyl-ACP methyl ester carboxylesterase
MPTEIQEHTFDTGVVNIHYFEGPPAGPPLVLLHGGSGRWQAHDLLDFADGFHVFAPDFRGHGKSGWVPGRYRFQDYADDTIAFLRGCVPEPACLFGHSMGGSIALLVAAGCPDRVRSVVVGDSPLRAEFQRPSSRAKIAAWRDLAGGKLSIEEVAEALKDAPTDLPGQDEPVTMREKHGEDSDITTHLAARLFDIDPDTLTALLDDFKATMAGYEMEKVLPAIRCPVLLLQADPDWCVFQAGVMTDAEVERALPLLAQPQHVRLEGRDHLLFYPDKEPAMSIIMDFLKSV